MQSSGPEQDDSFDFLFKIILVGDSDVGKTCVVQSFKSGVFMEKQQNTIGVDFTVRTMDIDGRKVKVRKYVSISGTIVYHIFPMLSTGHVVFVPSGILLLSIGLASLIVSLHSVNGSASVVLKSKEVFSTFLFVLRNGRGQTVTLDRPALSVCVFSGCVSSDCIIVWTI
jgi:hypothetical protein